MAVKADETPALERKAPIHSARREDPSAASSLEPDIALDVRMARLARILGTDEGFFLLALHSFVESFICEVYPSGKYNSSFPALLWFSVGERILIIGSKIYPLTSSLAPLAWTVCLLSHEDEVEVT